MLESYHGEKGYEMLLSDHDTAIAVLNYNSNHCLSWVFRRWPVMDAEAAHWAPPFPDEPLLIDSGGGKGVIIFSCASTGEPTRL